MKKLLINFIHWLKAPKVLYWVFLALLILPNVLMFFTESTSLWVRTLNVVLPCSVFWFVFTLFNKPGKSFWWTFLFVFYAAFQVVLLYLFGESPIAVDMFMNLFTTNPGEVDELLSQLLPSVIFVVVFYGGAIILAILSCRSKDILPLSFRKRQRVPALILLAISIALLVTCYAHEKRFKMRDDIFPVNVTYNTGLCLKRLYVSGNYHQASAAFSHHATLTRSDSVPEIYVLVIGETLRAESMGIYGYERKTTPHLSSLQQSGEIAVFKDAITMSNTTHKSVPLLLSAVGSEAAYDSLFHQKGIISAFREVGYSTAYYSNQRRNHSFIDFLGEEAEDVVFLKDNIPLTENIYDTRLVSLLKDKLQKKDSRNLFIVLHCYGSHFDYRDRYESPLAAFKPTDYPTASRRYAQQLVNAYDNTVRYADHVVGQIIDLLKSTQKPAVMLFTSDHGEDIFDDSRGRFLHASPIPTYHQLNVPYVVWASQAWRQSYGEQWQQLIAHQAQPVSSGMLTFHTLLDLSGLRCALFRSDFSLANPGFKAPARLYVNDHNEYRALDDCGLKDIDIQQFTAHGRKFP